MLRKTVLDVRPEDVCEDHPIDDARLQFNCVVSYVNNPDNLNCQLSAIYGNFYTVITLCDETK